MINNTKGNYFTRYTGKAQEIFASTTFTDAVEKLVDEKLSQFDLRYLDFNNSQTELLDDKKEVVFFNERVRKTHISSISHLHQNQQLVWEVENVFVSLSHIFYDFDTKEIGNIISEIINEVYEENIVKNLTANTFRKTFDKTFNLELSNIYGKLKTNIETLSKEYHIKGNIYKVKNEENPAYLQKINKVDFLTNNYYYFDKRKRQRFENRFKFISEDNLGNEEKELSKKLKDNNICCSYGVFKNSYGIFFNYTNETEKSQKTIFSYLSTPAFLKIFNESFETPFKSFDEFLELNNFRILETDDFKYIELLEIERYEDGSLRNYPKGFSAYAQLLCVFLGIKLSEYMYKHFKEFLHNSFNKVYVNIEIKNKISYSEKIEEFELLRKENFFDEIQTEMKKEDFQRVNLERLNTILKGNNTSIQMIKVVMTKTYIRLEKMIKKILKKSVVEVDLIEQKNNLAYKLIKKEEEKK